MTPVASPRARPGRRRLLAVSGAAAAVAGGAGLVGILAAPPLRLDAPVARTGPGADGRAVTEVTVRVHNRSDSTVRPSFLSLNGVLWAPGWRRSAGPEELAAGADATYTLVSSDPEVALQPGDGFAVGALVSDPASVSISPRAKAITAPLHAGAPIP